MSTSDQQTADRAKLAAAFLKLLGEYGEADPVQSRTEAAADPQIKNLSVVFAEMCARYNEGTILDIGCGEGILLERLAELPLFLKSSWMYFGSDIEERYRGVIHRAVDLRLQRRVDGCTLETLYEEWIPADLPRPLLVVARNVLHELDISSTATLLHLISSKMGIADTLLIQDLRVFPRAERNNVCWDPDIFERLLSNLNFSVVMVPEVSSSGNGWFTVIARPKGSERHSPIEVHDRVASARKAQLDLWRGMRKLPQGDLRPTPVALIDFDLQLGALQNQLHEAIPAEVNAPPEQEQSDLIGLIFQKHLSMIDVGALTQTTVPVTPPVHFRDRANNQDSLEEFLRSDAAVAILRGGALMGKSDLAQQVLAHRAHRRIAITVDVQRTSTIWNVMEQYVANVGCAFRYDIAASYRHLDYADVREPFSALLARMAPNSIVVLDHVERMLDFDGSIVDPDLEDFLSDLCAPSEAKVVITTQRTPDLSFLPSSTVVAPDQPPVGRLPDDKYVEYILDDFVDRATLDLAEYPAPLLEAIDRHPYLAVLAGRIIQHEGPASVRDESFLHQLRNKLRMELGRRIITEESRPALDVLSILRIPAPRQMVADLSNQESLRVAEELGLVYPSHDRERHDLITVMGALRDAYPRSSFSGADDDPKRTEESDRRHRFVAEAYSHQFKQNNDPRWLREAFYHTLAANHPEGIRQFGSIYAREIAWAGGYWFSERKDYVSALWAFRTAEEMGVRTYDVHLHLAACLIRVGQADEGEERYDNLFRKYPTARGPRTSYIDSLLYRREFGKALAKLDSLDLPLGDDPWVAHEYGRAYFGLHRYSDAIRAFEIQRKLKAEPLAFVMLARSYRGQGDRDGVERTLRDGTRRFPKDRTLLVSMAAHQISVGGQANLSTAEITLSKLHTRYPWAGDVLLQLAKLAYVADRQEMVSQLNSALSKVSRPERFALPVGTYLLFAQRRWEEAVRRLHGAPADNVHLIGLIKHAYLAWARSLPEAESRVEIARIGLAVAMHTVLEGNLPILVTSARLANLAGRLDEYEYLLEKVEALNVEVARMLRSESEEVTTYWEEPFDD